RLHERRCQKVSDEYEHHGETKQLGKYKHTDNMRVQQPRLYPRQLRKDRNYHDSLHQVPSHKPEYASTRLFIFLEARDECSDKHMHHKKNHSEQYYSINVQTLHYFHFN